MRSPPQNVLQLPHTRQSVIALTPSPWLMLAQGSYLNKAFIWLLYASLKRVGIVSSLSVESWGPEVFFFLFTSSFLNCLLNKLLNLWFWKYYKNLNMWMNEGWKEGGLVGNSSKKESWAECISMILNIHGEILEIYSPCINKIIDIYEYL